MSARRLLILTPVLRMLLRLGRRREGTAVVEFVFILPVALLIMSLVVYGGQIYAVQRKVTLATSTVSNIFAQGNNVNSATITNAQLQQILAYPNLILYPNDPTGVQVVISQLQVSTTNGVTTGSVVGSWANANAKPRICNTTIAVSSDIAAAFNGASNYVILGEIYYPFQPAGIYVSMPAITLHDSVMMIPRTASKIAGPTSGC